MISLGERGTGLTLNLIAVAVFGIMATIVFATVRSQVKTVIYDLRQAQAEGIAEAGIEDALTNLYKDNSWRTGFNQKAFGSGYYTVSLTTGDPPTIYSTGYSQSIAFTGRAVKTVSLTALFVTTQTATKGVTANSMNVQGTIDSYDTTLTLYPSTADFSSNVIIGSNGSVDTHLATCPPALIKASKIYYHTGGAHAAPDAACITGTSASTTTTFGLTVTNCSWCSGHNYSFLSTTTLNGQTYNQGSGALTIGGGTMTLTAGEYYFKSVSFNNNGVLNVDTSTGAVHIFIDVAFTEYNGGNCQVNNSSHMPSRLVIAQAPGQSAQADIYCTTTPLHAWLETPGGTQTNIHTNAVMYGHVVADTFTISSGAKMHFDMNEGISYNHLSWNVGSSASWGESYKRQ